VIELMQQLVSHLFSRHRYLTTYVVVALVGLVWVSWEWPHPWPG
jgi:hypothetical protein